MVIGRDIDLLLAAYEKMRKGEERKIHDQFIRSSVFRSFEAPAQTLLAWYEWSPAKLDFLFFVKP